ncbi:MAG: rhodanese-like domain-containing protein [Bacteroidia bacterium]|nr:rhodanese-like domain-containing protein [Bacteroidia bacterium]
MIQQINNSQFRQMMTQSDSVILDVRTAEEYKEGRIPRSINLDVMSGAIDMANHLDPNQTYLVYCRSGNRSMVAAYILESKGFSKVHNLKGGIIGWDGQVES